MPSSDSPGSLGHGMAELHPNLIFLLEGAGKGDGKRLGGGCLLTSLAWDFLSPSLSLSLSIQL